MRCAKIPKKEKPDYIESAITTIAVHTQQQKKKYKTKSTARPLQIVWKCCLFMYTQMKSKLIKCELFCLIELFILECWNCPDSHGEMGVEVAVVENGSKW